MDNGMIKAGALAGLIAVGGVATAVSAQTVAEATGLTEEQVIAIALEEVPGEVQEVELEREDGIQVYEIEILTLAGAEMEVEINADTGEILEVDADDKDCDKDDDDGEDA